MHRSRAQLRALVLLLVAAAAPLRAAALEDPWIVLRDLRKAMAAAPLTANFTQTYVPAGFSSGEKERGRLSISLPDCLRWDYSDPYPKSFLLCGEVVHYWSSEDKTGRRYEIDRSKEPGLDLVLLGVDQLRSRYGAEEKRTEDGKVEITLSATSGTTRPAANGDIREATLLVDPTAQRLLGLSYKDGEGNVTRFEISGYRPLTGKGVFRPPDGIEWREGEP